MDSKHDVYQKLWDMIRECRFAMLVTVEADGELRARPMTSVQKEFGGTLWFFAASNSAAVSSIDAHPDVCLAYSDSADADFVSVSGKATVEFDVDRKHKLWNPMVQAWFPQGPESSEVALIRVDANHAEYWDSTSNKLVQLYSLATAFVTGNQPRHMGEHRSVSF